MEHPVPCRLRFSNEIGSGAQVGVLMMSSYLPCLPAAGGGKKGEGLDVTAQERERERERERNGK